MRNLQIRQWSPWLLALALTTPPLGADELRRQVNAKTVIRPAPAAMCALLDDPAKVRVMDGLLFNLAWSCDRLEFLGPVPAAVDGPVTRGVEGEPDVQVNDDTGGSETTQSETTIAQNEVTGTLCSGFNDSCEMFCPGGGGGFTGFARSIDGGLTWDDRGAVGGESVGDPSVVWRRSDGFFYYATLRSGGGLALYRSTDDCQTFSFFGAPETGVADKELLAVDNWPQSPHFGNLYIAYLGGGMVARRSTDGGANWSAPVSLGTGQGAWPMVAPNGDVFVSWGSSGSGTVTIPISRSTDGGVSFTPLPNVITDQVQPRDATATNDCERDALNGNIRYLASPQLATTDDGVLHVVYSYDPDGLDMGDVVDVFYRRSTDSGATWSSELRLNDDATTNDQYFPTLSANGSTVLATWYDRRLDPANLLQDTFRRVSTDGGLTWGPNERLSDVSTPIEFDTIALPCYHGDYDQNVVTADGSTVAQWSDDRNAGEVADVFTEIAGAGLLFADGFETGDTSAWE
ncbi:MAG: sialidase family protein [Acidobacteriota bacterium]